jgi:hypothetical protein
MDRLPSLRRARPVLVVLCALALVPGVAHAAGITTTSKTLGAGVSAVGACGSLASATATWTATGGTVTALTVSGLPAGCAGATASVTLVDSGSNALASASGVSVSSGNAVFSSLSANPVDTAVAGIHVVLVGP